jgi:hypothetical protein
VVVVGRGAEVEAVVVGAEEGARRLVEMANEITTATTSVDAVAISLARAWPTSFASSVMHSYREVKLELQIECMTKHVRT